MAANNSVCDRHLSRCHTISILGQDFIDGPDLSCGVIELNHESAKFKIPAKYIGRAEIQCIFDRKSIHLHKGPRTFEIRVTNDGNTFSNEIFLTFADTSCHVCPEARMPQHPTTCTAKPGVCQTRYGCRSEGSLHPRRPCMTCNNTKWISSTKPVFSEAFVDVKLYRGETLKYKLDVHDSGVLLELGLHPEGAYLDGITLIWNTNTEQVDISQFKKIYLMAR